MVKPALASHVAGESALISHVSNTNINEYLKYYRAKKAIKKLLEKYDSPLLEVTDNFIYTCQKYQIDCYLLPAITGLESSFGKYIYPNSYNPFGWGGGYIMFKNWGEGIDTVGKGLRFNYINKGALTLPSIGRIYSESPTWAIRIQHFINELQKDEENQLYFPENEVKL